MKDVNTKKRLSWNTEAVFLIIDNNFTMLSFRIKKLGKSDADSLFFFGLCSLCPIIYLTFPKIQ